MSKHTPGPWNDKSLDGSQWGVYSADGRSVAQAQQITPLPSDRTQIERTANARLIAAAPELLEALKDLMREVDRSGLSEAKAYGWPVVTSAAIAAIAKAEGTDK